MNGSVQRTTPRRLPHHVLEGFQHGGGIGEALDGIFGQRTQHQFVQRFRDAAAARVVADVPDDVGQLHRQAELVRIGHGLGRGAPKDAAGHLAHHAGHQVAVALQAGVVDFNLGSVRVLEKNGFQEEGVDRCAIYKRGELHDLRRFARVRTQLP